MSVDVVDISGFESDGARTLHLGLPRETEYIDVSSPTSLLVMATVFEAVGVIVRRTIVRSFFVEIWDDWRWIE